MKFLSQEKKLESHMFMNGDKVVIYQKSYSFLETRKFIETVVGLYEKATEHYKNSVLNIPQGQPQ
jgi:phosphoheptose isomerase